MLSLESMFIVQVQRLGIETAQAIDERKVKLALSVSYIGFTAPQEFPGNFTRL